MGAGGGLNVTRIRFLMVVPGRAGTGADFPLRRPVYFSFDNQYNICTHGLYMPGSTPQHTRISQEPGRGSVPLGMYKIVT